MLATAVADALRDWQPPPDLADDARGAVMITLSNSLMTTTVSSSQLRAILQRLSEAAGGSPLSGLMRVLLSFDPADPDPDAFAGRLERLADDPDRLTALAASQWLCHLRENAGDAAGAIAAAKRTLALSRDDDGPWSAAMPRTMLAQLALHEGDRGAAVEYASAALPVLRRLGARDDEMQLRSLVVLCAIADGQLAEAKDELNRIDRTGDATTLFGGGSMRLVCEAELALASGDYPTGLRIHREAAARMRTVRLPEVAMIGLEPWVLFGDSIALGAHACYATGDDEAYGRALFLACRENAVRLLRAPLPGLDHPAAGQVLFALGAWALLRRPGRGSGGEGALAEVALAEVALAEVALRLLALASRFGYHRMMPTMTWDQLLPAAERAAPGQLDQFLAEYADRQSAGLVAEACRLAERLPG